MTASLRHVVCSIIRCGSSRIRTVRSIRGGVRSVGNLCDEASLGRCDIEMHNQHILLPDSLVI